MKNAKCVIWDLDGTIIDTERLCVEAASEVIGLYGKALTMEMKVKIVGRRQIDVYAYLIEKLEIDETLDNLVAKNKELLDDKFEYAAIMPGAIRLLEHLKEKDIPMALATSTDRNRIPKKLKGKEFILDFFREVVGGDQVDKSKPSPSIFNLTAQKMQVEPEDCLVFEDSVVGTTAACLAGMQVILVPSIPNMDIQDLKGYNFTLLKSLLDFNPMQYGLPPLMDSIDGVIKMNPIICLAGTVVQGFGRGAKELGIRTANLDEESLADALSSAVTGIYTGWASVGADNTVYKMVMSIGWNPYYKNVKKTAEAWLLHELPQDFYGEHLRLVVCGYIRPEADFTSLEDLIEKIHQDAEISKRFLSHPDILIYKNHDTLHPLNSRAS